MKRFKYVKIAAAGLPVFFSMVFLTAFCLGFHPYIVLSGSMEPAIPTGSIVFIDTHDQTPDVSDVITYQNGGQNVTHRVVQVLENGTSVTKGDANDMPDPSPVSPGQIIGIVKGYIPWLGYGICRIRSSAGILCLLVLLFLTTYRKNISKKIQPGKKGTSYENE